MKYQSEIPEIEEYDLIVCGGGPSGCAAALAAARAGLTTLLVEGMGQLGGSAVTALVSQWLGGRTEEGAWVVGGIFKSLSEEATEKGYALLPALAGKPYQPFGWYNWFVHGVPLDPYAIDRFLDEKMAAAGVDVLLHTQVVDVVVSERQISHVVIYNRSGLQAIRVKAVIDATGNAEVAFKSGCANVKGRPEDGKMTPASLIFHVYNVDQEALTRFIEQERDPKLRRLIRQLRASGTWDFPYDLFICTRLPTPGEFYINTTRLTGVDGTDGQSISDGMKRGRQEVAQLMAIFQKYIPGFEHARIKAIAPQLGIRETRRIVGAYTLTVDDLTAGREFEDCIGFSMYGWDLPHPDKPSVQPLADDRISGYTYKVKKALSTPIPYRIMVPQPVKNLINPGRAVSAAGQALGPIRVMAPCMAMGEAAGIAAGQVVNEDIAFSEVNVGRLRQSLREVGAIVDRAALPPIYPRVDQV